MKNKYYIPTIEELHIGFECEILGIIGANEDSRLFSQTTIVSKKELELFEVLEIRVKYLDQEDIESLGWKFNNSKPSPFTGKLISTYTLHQEYGFNTGSTHLLEELDSNKFLITNHTYSSYGSTKEEMTFSIKNKSELKKLMQQLNIK